jgi:hypothetical protein
MLKRSREQGRLWRKRILDAVRPELADGEDPTVLAIAQRWSSWLVLSPMVVGIVMVQQGFFGDLPQWVGVAGIPVAIIGSVFIYTLPRKAVIRTDRRVIVFNLGRDTKNPEVVLERTVALERLPVRWEGGINVDGETLHAWNDSRRERELLKAVFATDPENPQQ